MRFRVLARFLTVLVPFAGLAPVALAQDNAPKPPEGFKAIFDGKTLAGWHGMPHFDPRELAAMSPEARAAVQSSVGNAGGSRGVGGRPGDDIEQRSPLIGFLSSVR